MKRYKRRGSSGALVVISLLAGLFALARPPAAGSIAPAAATPAPDLIIQSLAIVPETPAIGETVTFTVTVKNQGESPSGASQLAIFIDEQSLALLPVSALEAGTVAVKTFSWKARAGPHIFRAVADSDGGIPEDAENNNDKILAFSVLAPDLAVDAIAWAPFSPVAGDKVTFTVTLANQGDKMSGGSHLEIIIDGSTRGYTPVPGLDAGASVNVTLFWTALSGRHIVRAVADALDQVKEGDEENNISEATCATALPDLIISSLTAVPVNPAAGEAVMITATVKNQGAGKAGPAGLSFYADGGLLEWVFLGAMAPGATATQNLTWIATSGPPLLKVTADAEGQVPETDEGNNSQALSLAPIYPDLTITDITWSPTAPLLSSPVTFTVTVKNQGKAMAGYAEVKLDIDRNAYVFQGSVANLSANTSATVLFSWLPRSLSHSVRATIDENNLLAEDNDANNTLTKTMTSARPTPTADLVPVAIMLSPAKPATGETVAVTLTVKNQGTGAAGASTTGFYLDSDLIDTVYTGELEAGKTTTLTITLPLEGLTLKSSYQVSALLDVNDTVFETSEANNNKATSLSIAAPDVLVQSVSWTPEVPAAGGSVTFDVAVKNRGDLKAGSFFVSYYIDNVFMGKHYLENVEAGTTVSRSFTWAVTRAAFVFSASVDEERQLTESDELNNARPFVIPAPDLTIDSLTWSPRNPAEISPVYFNAVIRNRGYGRASGSVLHVYINGDLPLSLNMAQIGPGDTATVSFNYAFAPGERSLRLVADGDDALAESSETNNEKTVKITVSSRTPGTPPPASPSAANATVARPASPAPSVTVTAGSNITSQNKTMASPVPKDIAGNITSATPAWQGILHNTWIIGGIAAIGLAAIGLLLMFRKKARRPRAEEPPAEPTA